MNKDSTLKQLRELNLEGMATAYESIMNLPVNKQPEGHTMLAQMAEKEYYYRSHKRQEMYLKLSKLRYKSTLEDVICSKERNLTEEMIAKLIDCTFIKSGTNILISGSTGSGKSYLACALASQACSRGYKAMYYNMNKLIEQIMLSKADGSYLKLLSKLEKYPVLVIDDFGLQSLNKEISLSILQILEDRYRKKSTIIISQIPVGKWGDVITDPTIGDAIIDRILYNSEKIELRGKSMRELEVEAAPAG